MEISSNQQALLTLVKAGLWEQSFKSIFNEPIDFDAVYQLAEEQGVVGLVAAGFEYVVDARVPKEIVLTFIGSTLQVEQRNQAMNLFIRDAVSKMQDAGIKTLLVKGQGLAQCYERPLWRPSGDIDFLFDDENYRKAVKFMLPLSSGNKPEGKYSKHLGLSVGQWYVELHGSLRSSLSTRIDKEIDAVHDDTFKNGNTRVWRNGDVDIMLPGVDNDIFFVFTHYIKHFYKEEGASLRQICDWCRLLWTYRDSIDVSVLQDRIQRAGLISEWKVFATFAVEYLGMPVEAMPLLSDEKILHRKAKMLAGLILNDVKLNKLSKTYKIAKLFPFQTLRYIPSIVFEVNWLKLKERLFK